MSNTKPLPEKYRKARNIDEGHEVRLEDGTWGTVVSALHILGPIKICSFTVQLPDGTIERLRGMHPNDEVMSRKPASTGAEVTG